jgi:hypothetical protein
MLAIISVPAVIVLLGLILWISAHLEKLTTTGSEAPPMNH